MENIKAISCWGEASGNYDPSTANNGGDYWQFVGGAMFATEDGHHVIIDVDDQSCGDFGTRRWYDITVQDVAAALTWGVNMGSMDDASIDPPEVIDAVLAAIAAELRTSSTDVEALIRQATRAASEVAWMEGKWQN